MENQSKDSLQQSMAARFVASATAPAWSSELDAGSAIMIRVEQSGNVTIGQGHIVPDLVMQGGQWHPGIEVIGFGVFKNECIACAINEGHQLHGTFEDNADNDGVPWHFRIVSASSEDLGVCRLLHAVPHEGARVITEDGYTFYAVNGRLVDNADPCQCDLSFDRLSDLTVAFKYVVDSDETGLSDLRLDWHFADSAEQPFVGVFATTRQAHEDGEPPVNGDVVQVAVNVRDRAICDLLQDAVMYACEAANNTNPSSVQNALASAADALSLSSKSRNPAVADLLAKLQAAAARSVNAGV